MRRIEENGIRFPSRSWLPGLAAALLLLALILPAMADPSQWKGEGWTKTEFAKTSIQWSEVMSGGPPKDGIPSIDKPLFKTIGETREVADVEPVIGLEVGGDARAYPIRILIWHEIVNDTIAGKPVAVTYCPLCNSAIVFDRTVKGRVLDFGTTGKLRNSDLVMYDRQTESWWQQFTGEAIVGVMLGSELKMLPARLESYREFKARHPAGKVLQPVENARRPYGTNPYTGYDTAKAPFLFRGDLPKDVPAMSRVVLVRPETGPRRAVLLTHLRKVGRLKLGDIELAWTAGQASALDDALIQKGRDVGTVSVTSQVSGAQRPVTYDVTFAFVVNAFHPDVPIIKE